MTSDQSYFYQRAEQELKMAQATEVPQAAKAHYVLAGNYLDLVYGPKDEKIDAPLFFPQI